MLLLQRYAPLWLAGLLGAGIMAAVMASDSQILALSTMFTEDVFAFYGGKTRFGEAVQVQTGRIFIILITLFRLCGRFARAGNDLRARDPVCVLGFAALSPFDRGVVLEGKHEVGRAGSYSLDALAVVAVAVFQSIVPAPAPGPPTIFWAPGGVEVLSRTPGGTAVFGFMPVVPMVIVSALLMIVVSLPRRNLPASTLAKYFGGRNHEETFLAFVAIAMLASYAAAQTAKRRAVKTGTPNGIFSPAIITGDLVYTSGQIGIDSKTGQLAEGASKRNSSRFLKIWRRCWKRQAAVSITS
jgi:Na+/proline symporter